MALLTKIEDIISIPMELFHKQKGFHPVDLNRMAMRCIERGCRKGIKQVYAPNRFEVALSPEDYDDLLPFLDIIRSDITGELRGVIEERDYLLAGDLEVEIVKDPEIPEGLPCVNGFMHGGPDEESSFSYTELVEEALESEDVPFSMDGRTILMEPEADAEPSTLAEETLEEGSTLLREGKAEEAHKVIDTIRDDFEETPRYLAAMAVATQMLDRRLDALEHSGRLQQIEGGRSQAPPRLEWRGRSGEATETDGLQPTVLGRLELKGTGVVLNIRSDGVYIENSQIRAEVRVDGQKVSGILLEDGAEIKIGDVELAFDSGLGVS